MIPEWWANIVVRMPETRLRCFLGVHTLAELFQVEDGGDRRIIAAFCPVCGLTKRTGAPTMKDRPLWGPPDAAAAVAVCAFTEGQIP